MDKLLLSCCSAVAQLLLSCCSAVAQPLLICCSAFAQPLLTRCSALAQLLLSCCSAIAQLLLSCCFAFAQLLLSCCYGFNNNLKNVGITLLRALFKSELGRLFSILYCKGFFQSYLEGSLFNFFQKSCCLAIAQQARSLLGPCWALARQFLGHC